MSPLSVPARLSVLVVATSGLAWAQPAVDLGSPTPNWQIGPNVSRTPVAGSESSVNGQTGLVSTQGPLVAVSPHTFTTGGYWVNPDEALGFYNNSPSPAFYGGSKLILSDANVVRTSANALAASGLANDFLNPQLSDYIVAGSEVELNTEAKGSLEALYLWQQNDWSDYTTGNVAITSDHAFSFTGNFAGEKLTDVFGHWVVEIGGKLYVSTETFALGTGYDRSESKGVLSTTWQEVSAISGSSLDSTGLVTLGAETDLELTGITSVGVYLEALVQAGFSSELLLRMIDFEFAPGGLEPVIPEPSTYAALTGVTALAVVMLRRRARR